MTITRLAILLLCFISVTSCKVSYKKNINPDVGAGFGGGGDWGGGGGGGGDSPGVYLNAKVCLEGAVNQAALPGSLEMVPTLNSSGTLPYATPYTSAPWFHYSASDIALGPTIYEDGDLDPLTGWVDWVLVEVYSLNNGSYTKAAQSALLNREGKLFNTSGQQGLFFSTLYPGDYYINIKHRNHLAIANLTAVSLNAQNLEFNLDFTDPLNPLTTTTLQQTIGTYQCMLAGDVNSDNRIDSVDLGLLNAQVDSIFSSAVDGTALNGYFLTDTNLDGTIIKDEIPLADPDHLLIDAHSVPIGPILVYPDISPPI